MGIAAPGVQMMWDMSQPRRAEALAEKKGAPV